MAIGEGTSIGDLVNLNNVGSSNIGTGNDSFFSGLGDSLLGGLSTVGNGIATGANSLYDFAGTKQFGNLANLGLQGYGTYLNNQQLNRQNDLQDRQQTGFENQLIRNNAIQDIALAREKEQYDRELANRLAYEDSLGLSNG